jgi:hypothetical protein
MENVNDEMQKFLVEEPFAYEEQEPQDCKKEAVDLGECPNEVILV